MVKIKREYQDILLKEGNYMSDVYRGHTIRAIRNYLNGTRCGYVGLHKTSSIFGMPYEQIPVSVHGGITYGDSSLHMQPETDLRWIGFDCGHYYDVSPYETYSLQQPGDYRTKEFVITKLKSLVDQIFLISTT